MLEKSGGRTRKCTSHTATRKRLTPGATRSAPKSCRRICSCPVTPPVCVRLYGSITRFSGVGGPVWPPVCAVPTALAGPSRFRGTAVPCGRLKSCRGGGRRLTECHMGLGGLRAGGRRGAAGSGSASPGNACRGRRFGPQRLHSAFQSGKQRPFAQIPSACYIPSVPVRLRPLLIGERSSLSDGLP